MAWSTSCCIDKSNSTELSKAMMPRRRSTLLRERQSSRKYTKHSVVMVVVASLSFTGWEESSFGNAARRILQEHPSAQRLGGVDLRGSLGEVVEAVKGWLSLPNNTRWLVVYDNYVNPKVAGNTDAAALEIRKYLPESHQGSVIITTRSSQVTIGHRTPVRKLENVQDCLEIQSNASSRKELISDPDAAKLVKELDGLPLALATSGAYLEQVTTSLAEYLRLYTELWLKLQKKSPELSSYEGRLYSTWDISYKQVQQQNRLSTRLLQLWPYFDNRDLWFELLLHSDIGDPEWVREFTEDRVNFDGAIRVLCNHGLVEADSTSQKKVESQGRGLRSNGFWRMRLAIHRYANGGMEWAVHNLGDLYSDQGKLKEAEEMYIRALQGYEEALGPKHTSTLDMVNNLGLFYADQGKLKRQKRCTYERCKDTRYWTPSPFRDTDQPSTLYGISAISLQPIRRE
ncbi:hypothetical protein P152DRAFT_447276 [Eremomyces bilateralis CBS 781.70]|uniref:TPR-like protein n=1 Tax=Eremomyces bilateralis CBS 781.70 TaxID=1392243 RepID=A0A6G1GAE5_9PEZI|nr:uncharacterized protein P152DRAFT_447276 [Eremomyces bilateralis CBS 781.70]KAF1815003.1 hypothetical protein P152DRAFT_447276 [Eremomyces bilateralis CBS 781.70]